MPLPRPDTKTYPPRGGGVIAPGVGENDIPGRTYTPDISGLVAPIKPAPDGYLWVSEEAIGDKKPGEEVEVVAGRGVMIGYDVGLVPIRGGYVKTR